jgi:hypothetical protein
MWEYSTGGDFHCLGNNKYAIEFGQNLLGMDVQLQAEAVDAPIQFN